jgi:hypothetical protein
MAHSIQAYKGKTEVINDLDLLIIMGFVLKIVNQSPEFRGLRNLVAQWQESLREYGPGIIDLKLEQFVQGPNEVSEFGALLSTVLNQVSYYHEAIPADVLNKQLSVLGVTFSDCKVSSVEEAVKKLQALIAGN